MQEEMAEANESISNEEKLGLIKQQGGRVQKLISSDSLKEQAIVIIGYEFKRETLILTRVGKANKQGVIQTDAGIRFSTKSNEITSTQKINGSYWSMFNIEGSYKSALKRQAELKLMELEGELRHLRFEVSRLNSITDADLIEQLKNLIKQHKSSSKEVVPDEN